MSIHIVESGEGGAVDVEDGSDGSIPEYRYYDFAAREGGAGDVAREEVHVGDDLGARFGPRCAANAFPTANAGAGKRALEGAEHQFFALDAIEACPPKTERLVKHGCHIRHVGYEVGLILHNANDLGQEFFVLLPFRPLCDGQCFCHITLQRFLHRRTCLELC